MRNSSTAWVWLFALVVALRSFVPWAHGSATAEHPVLMAFCGSSSAQLQSQARGLLDELLEDSGTSTPSEPCLGCVQAQAAALPVFANYAPTPLTSVFDSPGEHCGAPTLATSRPYAIRAPPQFPS